MEPLQQIPRAAVAATGLVYFASLIFYRLFLHPLAKFPGPKLAAITRYYEGYYGVILNGQYTFKIAQLHQQYGPIVRISPYELHINDPAYFDKLYRHDGQWNKYDWSYDAFGAPMAAICTLDHEMHKCRSPKSSGAIWRVTKHVRWLSPLTKSLPVDWIEKKGDAGTKAFFGFLKNFLAATKAIVAKSSSKKTENGPNSHHETVVHAILYSNLPPAEKTVERNNDEVDTITGAAFETAAQSIRTVLYHLYSDPVLLRRLRDELDQAAKQQGGEGNLSVAALERLPFLTGAIYEGLRLSPGLATRLARVAPDRDLFYDQWRIPAGTAVGMNVLLMHLNEDLYPQPKAFNPDRWSEAVKRADKTFAPFFGGTRICLGMYLAWAEMYIVVASLAQRLDFELVGAGPKDVECASDQFIVGTKDQTGIRGILKGARVEILEVASTSSLCG